MRAQPGQRTADASRLPSKLRPTPGCLGVGAMHGMRAIPYTSSRPPAAPDVAAVKRFPSLPKACGAALGQQPAGQGLQAIGNLLLSGSAESRRWETVNARRWWRRRRGRRCGGTRPPGCCGRRCAAARPPHPPRSCGAPWEPWGTWPPPQLTSGASCWCLSAPLPALAHSVKCTVDCGNGRWIYQVHHGLLWDCCNHQ